MTTPTTAFPHLLAPGRIGTLELRNRILMCPMGDSLAEPDGTISARQAAYFEARARGGAALLLVGSVSIAYPAGSYSARQVAVSDDRFLPGLQDLTERAHRHGARIAAQLVHDGQVSLHDIESGRPLLVPAVPRPGGQDRLSQMVTPSEMAAMAGPFTAPGAKAEYRVATEDDIAWVVETFADAAERAERAGFDGVELHAGHGYLLDEFLSPATNTRTDGWGGAVENRARLLCDVVRAIRARLGPGFPLWCRLNAVERFREGGETLEDAVAVAKLAVAAGLDAVHVSAYADTGVGIGITEAHTPHEPGLLVDYAAAVKEAVDVPVITFGRLEPEAAEEVLAAGKADFVAMGRKLLADPDLPRKLAEGRVDDVRPCIYQYRCIGNIFVRSHVACVANAATGREDEVQVEPAAVPRRVLVAGGGPAGLEAARLLAGRGHHVTLWERSERLGGALALAARTDEPLDRFLGWLLRQVDAAGVELVLGAEVTPEAVRAHGADEVVVATGARWERPDVPGAALPHVRSLPELGGWLDGDDGSVGERVVIVGGGKTGLSLAALCRRRGRDVTVLEPSGVFGVELGLPGRFRLVHDLEAKGARLLGGMELAEVTDGAVRCTSAGGATEELAADAVLLVSGAVPDTALADALAGAGIAARTAGDCGGVRHIEGAMLDALQLAAAV